MFRRIRKPNGRSAEYYRAWIKAVGQMWINHKPKRGSYRRVTRWWVKHEKKLPIRRTNARSVSRRRFVAA